MKNRFCFLFLFVLIIFVSCSSHSLQKKSSEQFKAMNTYITLTSYGKNAKRANKIAQKRIEKLESELSTTIPESEVFKINENNSKKIELNNSVFYLLEFSLGMAEETGGALNPALYPITKLWGFTTGNYKVPKDEEIKNLIPKTNWRALKITEEPGDEEGTVKEFLQKQNGMMIDFGAVAKGFAGDEVIRIYKDSGITSALLDLGGNIQTLGAKPDGSEWNIGIKNPWEAGIPCCGVKVINKAVITSGGYERFFFDENGKKYIHIFDPKTGKPVENELESVTVIADSGLYADSLSTSLFVMGSKKAIDFWKTYRDFEAVFITKDGTLIYTSGLKDKITILLDFENIKIAE